MRVDRCRRFLLLLVRALAGSRLRGGVHEDASLPIHRVHAREDRLLTAADLRRALHQDSGPLRRPRRLRGQRLSRDLILLALRRLVAGAGPLATRD